MDRSILKSLNFPFGKTKPIKKISLIHTLQVIKFRRNFDPILTFHLFIRMFFMHIVWSTCRVLVLSFLYSLRAEQRCCKICRKICFFIDLVYIKRQIVKFSNSKKKVLKLSNKTISRTKQVWCGSKQWQVGKKCPVEAILSEKEDQESLNLSCSPSIIKNTWELSRNQAISQSKSRWNAKRFTL